jgi:hypothetical protein
MTTRMFPCRPRCGRPSATEALTALCLVLIVARATLDVLTAALASPEPWPVSPFALGAAAQARSSGAAGAVHGQWQRAMRPGWRMHARKWLPIGALALMGRGSRASHRARSAWARSQALRANRMRPTGHGDAPLRFGTPRDDMLVAGWK